MTITSAVDQVLPIVLTLAAAGAFTPLIVQAFRLLDQLVAHIQDTRARAWATVAVHDAEQQLAAAPSAEKKAAAVSFLKARGVPATVAGELVESSVHVMNQAASTYLEATPITALAGPPVDLSGVRKATADELHRIADQMLTPPDPSPPIQNGPPASAPIAGVTNIARPQNLPAAPPTPATTLDAERQAEEVRADIAASTADFGVLAQEATASPQTAAPGGAVEPVPAVLPGAGG